MSGTDYVLGTHDEEIARLGLQHRAWRSRALAAWQKGEFSPGLLGETHVPAGH